MPTTSPISRTFSIAAISPETTALMKADVASSRE